MQDPTFRAPLPTPDGNTPARTPMMSDVHLGDWQTAPVVVKGWVYPLTWLALVVLPIAMIAVLFMPQQSSAERFGLFVLYAALFGFQLWINRGIKKGTPAIWTVQMILSILGLVGFPIGTLIHGYILSQWFKPETKAWFGRS